MPDSDVTSAELWADRGAPSLSIARGAMALFGTQPLTWGASLMVAMLVPRYLGGQAYGELAVVSSVAGLVGVIVALGVPDFLRRQVALHQDRAANEAAGAMLLLLGLAVLAAVGLFIAWPIFGGTTTLVPLLLIALAGMIMGTGQSILFAVLVGQERHARFAWLNAVGTLIGAVAGVYMLMSGWGVEVYLAATVAATGVMSVIGWCTSSLGVSRARLVPSQLKQLVLGGLPFLGWNIAIRVRAEIYVVIVAMLLHEQSAGWLAAAYRITYVPLFIPTLITTPLLPVLSRYAGDPIVFRRTLRESLIAVFGVTVPAGAMTMALAPSIPELLGWSAEFQHSVPFMMILAFAQPLVALGMVLGTGLIALRQERRWLNVAIAAALVNPSLNLLLIPVLEQWFQNGAMGAVIAEVATELVMLAGAFMLLPRGIVDRGLVIAGARILVAGICLGLVTTAARTVPLPAVASVPFSAAAGGVTFVLVALLLGCFRLADVRNARSLLQDVLSRRSNRRSGDASVSDPAVGLA
ncbi:MAG: oligosaccharide flippase family protein [Chloroflexota bacterium]